MSKNASSARSDGPTARAGDGSEPAVLPYFRTLELDADAAFSDAYRKLFGVVSSQLKLAHEHVAARQAAKDAEERHKATTKWKQLEEEVKAAAAKKKATSRDEVGDRTKFDKQKETLSKTVQTMAELYPGMSPLQAFAKTNSDLYSARVQVQTLDKAMEELRKEEESLDAAIFEAVKKSYRSLSLRMHPDRLPHSTEADTRRFQELKEAYAVLSDTSLRKKYLQLNDHAEFVKAHRPKTDDHYDSKSDQQRATRAQQKATPATPDGPQAPRFRLMGGVPHRCTQPEIFGTKVTDRHRGDTIYWLRWTCSEAENLGVKFYNVTMTVHPIGHGKSTTNNMGSVKHPQYQTSPLMPGLYDFSVTAVNDHAAGEPSQPLRIYVPDLEEERAEREREYAKKEESRRAALRDEWDREIASIEAELSTGSKSMTKLDELIGQIRGIIAIMKRNSANRTFMDRAEAVHTKLSRAKYAKMELATWRTMLQKGVRDILSGAGRPDDAGSDFAQDVLEWPSANELAPAVRNLIYQTIVNLAESVPLLQIVMDQEVQNLLTPSEIAALGASDFERSDVEGDTAEMVYAPKWREIQPYDRTIEVLRACHLRPELFGTWLGKISGMHAKMERERKRRESEWKTKVSKEKRAAEKAAELASLEVAARMGSWTPEHSSETVGEDAARNDTSISEFTRVSESSDTTESEGVASASGSANGEAFATTSFSPPFPVVDVAEIPVEEHDFAELESADREVKVAPLRQQNSTAEASVSAQHVVAPQDTTSALLPDSTVASEQVSQLSDVLSPERRAIERPSIAQQANRIEEPAARHETPSRRQEPLSKPESDSGSLPVEEDRYASGNVPTAQSPKSAKGAPKASPHSSQQRSGIWKASKKCTRVNPDGSCVHAVRCWFSSMHTWQPAQPVQPGSSAAPALPTAPPTPLARTDGDSVLNGLNIIITKNPVVPIAAPAPSEVDKAAEKTASFVADETESVKVAKKVSPIESQEIAALWDMPSPTIPNLSRRNDDAGSRTTEEKNVEARRPLAAPPGLKHPLDKPSAPQQKQPASQSPQRISKPAVPPEAQAKRASEFAPRRSAPPPAPSSGETKLSDFLRTVGLARFVQLFEEHEFDMESLMLASDEDFRALKLPLGPMLKLKEGIKKLRESMKSLPEDSTNGMSDAGGYGDSEEASEEEPGEAVEGQQHFFGSQQQIAHGQAVSQQPDLSRQVYMTAADGSAYIVQQAYQPFTTMAQMHIARQPIKVPGHFVCPITRTIMSHPVVAPDGYTYQEDAIRNWLKQNGTSPMTQVPLTHDKDGRKTKIVLTPNYALRALILEFQATYPEHLYQYETM